MEKSSLQQYIGIPVLVQLKLPIVGSVVRYQQKLDYAEKPDVASWIPEPMMDESGPQATQMIQFAVLLEVEGSDTMLEMRWMAPKTDVNQQLGVIATLIDMDSIAAVTRVLKIHEASLILKG